MLPDLKPNGRYPSSLYRDPGQGIISGEPSIEIELERSIDVARWPGGTASNVGLLNLAAPSMMKNNELSQNNGLNANEIKPADGLIQKFTNDI